MSPQILVGTRDGLWRIKGDTIEPEETFAGRTVTALAADGARTGALEDGRTIWAGDGSMWQERASLEGPAGTCLALSSGALLIGTEEAHLFCLTDALERIEAFESVEGRGSWYTPWGDPAAVRSIAIAAGGPIYVNVHVGGIVRSRDGGRSWSPTVDIEADVHQVLAHPTRADVVLVAAFAGFGVSCNGGDSWEFITFGMHAHYSRAVATSDASVLISASTGPRGHRSTIYRKPLDENTGFVRCRDGLPEWFDDNIDTACLAAAGRLAVFGTRDGRVFRSLDGGERWHLFTEGLPAIECVTIG